jgi:hypothetical protein
MMTSDQPMVRRVASRVSAVIPADTVMVSRLTVPAIAVSCGNLTVT